MYPQLFAYLDAGSASVIVQALVGGVAGFVVVVKMGGRRFLSFLPFVGKKFRDDPIDHEPTGSNGSAGEDAAEGSDETDLAALLEDAADS